MKTSKKYSLNTMIHTFFIGIVVGVLLLFIINLCQPPVLEKTKEQIQTEKVREFQAILSRLDFTKVFEDWKLNK